MLSKRQLVIGLLVPLLVFQVACHKQQAAAKPKVLGPKEAPTLTVTLPDEIQPEPLPDAPPETAKVQEPPPQPKKTRAHKKGSTSPQHASEKRSADSNATGSAASLPEVTPPRRAFILRPTLPKLQQQWPSVRT